MAKIIRVSKRAACWWAGHQVWCGRCGCGFILETADRVTPITPGPEYLFEVPCPLCGKFVVVTKPDWL